MALTTGTRIGPYEIVALLGAGGMGEVYRARDDRLSRDVAVKVLPATFASDPDRLRRFEQEARAAFERGKIPSRIFRIEIATGKREFWHAIGPRNPSGVAGINSILMSRNGRSFVASYMRDISELYIAHGVQ